MNKHIDKEWLDNHKVSWYFEAIKWNVWERVTARYEKFVDLDIRDIQMKTWKQVDAILLDVDDCIAPAYGDILEENIQKINEILDSGIKVWILSNGQNIPERIQKIQGKVWNRIQICNTWIKPDPQAFLKACEQLWVDPENTLMVWDDIWVDGWSLRLDSDWKQIIWAFAHIQPIWNSYLSIPKKKVFSYMWKKLCRWIVNYRNK